MTTKLTLTVEKTIIEKAKSYAKETGRSLSELIATWGPPTMTAGLSDGGKLVTYLKRNKEMIHLLGLQTYMPQWLNKPMENALSF